MKFLVDANIPFKLAEYLKNKGFDVIHTDNLPNKELSTDAEIREKSIKENRIIITKDSDFLDSHIIKKIPSKLLYVTTGNIRNVQLLKIFEIYFQQMFDLFKKYDLIEISASQIIVHEKQSIKRR